MIRRAFTMRLKPGSFDEYKRHHDNIWPDLVAEIERSGIASITTFRSGDSLFLFSEITDLGAWDRLWHSDVHRRWAEVMEPLMHLKPDGIVDFGELTEIFRVETPAAGGTTRRGARPGRGGRKNKSKSGRTTRRPAAKKKDRKPRKIKRKAGR